MNEFEILLRDIEKLRENLQNLIKDKGMNLLDPEVLAASQKLNHEITKYNDIITKKSEK